GLISAVRDPREEEVDGERTVVDAGVSDKRVQPLECELASVLRRMQREANTLSAILRDAWDGVAALRTATKHSPLVATGAHVSMMSHITRDELVANLTDLEMANGFGNRILFWLVRRARILPEGKPVPDATLVPLIAGLREAVHFAQGVHLVERDAAAREIWAGIYPDLSEGEPGLLGALLSRAPAHVLRLSVLYAVLDHSAQVQPPHLLAALAAWDYCSESTRMIFGDRVGLTCADTILGALRQRGPLRREMITGLFHRNVKAPEIDAALRILATATPPKVRMSTRPPEGGHGRPAEVWEALS
ncbi:MAG: DUF3987 domain-containing protein, partial [bacterium]